MAIDILAENKRTDLSQLDYTYDLISSLTDDELEAVQAIAIAFIKKDRAPYIAESRTSIHPFQPQTEEQLLARIDRSLEQISMGLYRDVESVEDELLNGLN